MRIAYADPPYIGQAAKHYKDHPDYNGEVDHSELITRLVTEYPDGWALSCSSPSLRILLPLCPEDARIGSWVKPFCIFKPGVNPAYSWEPVIWRGGRKRGRDELTVQDWVAANVTLRRGVVGAKPAGFCYWLFELLGLGPDDELDDLYPGTHGVTRAWQEWRAARAALLAAM